jgi:sarcosine oxidase subunit gamma
MADASHILPTVLATPWTVAATPWLTPLPPAARFILHGGEQARERASGAWSAAFSEVACRASVAGTRATLWLGPDEYLLLAPAEESAAIAADLERVLDGSPHALVDVSHRQTAMRISGPHAEALLSGACPLDLEAGEFPVNMCTRTVFAKADIVLWRTAADSFHLEVWRSFSDYVTAMLTEIARGYVP